MDFVSKLMSRKNTIAIRCTYIRAQTYTARKNALSIRCLYIRGLDQMDVVSRTHILRKNTIYIRL